MLGSGRIGRLLSVIVIRESFSCAVRTQSSTDNFSDVLLCVCMHQSRKIIKRSSRSITATSIKKSLKLAAKPVTVTGFYFNVCNNLALSHLIVSVCLTVCHVFMSVVVSFHYCFVIMLFHFILVGRDLDSLFQPIPLVPLVFCSAFSCMFYVLLVLINERFKVM